MRRLNWTRLSVAGGPIFQKAAISAEFAEWAVMECPRPFRTFRDIAASFASGFGAALSRLLSDGRSLACLGEIMGAGAF